MEDKKDIIVVKGKDQASQIFKEMKGREVDRLNFNYNGTMQFLIEVRDKLHDSGKMVRDLKGLRDLKKLIDEHIDIIANTGLTMPETCHFEGNEQLVKRNADFNMKAIKILKKSLKVIKGRIKIIETQESESVINSQPEPEKEYDSIARARAFYIMKMFQNDRFSQDVIESKKRIIETVDREFPGQAKNASRIVYEELRCKGIYHNLEKQIVDHKLDYEYGIKLYKEKYPD